MTQHTDEAAARRRNIESIYPLAPLQEGILFHTLMAPDDAGIYIPQMAYHLEGPIDRPRMRAAWQGVLARHSALRSAIHWEERDQPFQIVYRDLPLSWEELDWQGQDTDQALADLFARNRARPFDLRRPPLLRLQLARVGDDRHVLILCHHHLILDGWSTARMLQDVMALYRGAALPPARPYADFIRWLKQQDHARSLGFWREYTQDTPGPSIAFGAVGETPRFERREWAFPGDLADGVQAFCKTGGVTFNTLLQGALGLYVAEKLGRDDIFFGSATAGRPASLAGSTEMVGLFINALPTRARIDRAQTVGQWLTALQTRQAATIEHEHIALRDIQGNLGTLFDCLLVVENYPVTMGDGGGDITLGKVEFDEWTHFPLTLLVAPGHAGMKLILRHDASVLSANELRAFLTRYVEILRGMIRGPDSRVESLVAPLASLPPAMPQHTDKSDTARPPETETEREIARIWAEVLKQPPPMATDNFFLSGGHSLLAAKVVTRLGAAFGIDLPVRALFDRPVLADLATHIDAQRIGHQVNESADAVTIEI